MFQSVSNAVFQSVPSAVFLSVPSAVFQNVPSAVFLSVPSAVFQSIPSAVFQSVPSAVFQSIPSAVFQSVPKPIFPISVYISMPKARLNISRTTGVLGRGDLPKLVKGKYGWREGGTFTSGESRESLSLSRTNCAKQNEITNF